MRLIGSMTVLHFRQRSIFLFEYEEYDSDRKCQVYFPTYYPNGDYHFFVDKEWKYGLFGHPWKHEIVVMGEKLIEMFEKEKVRLEFKINKRNLI